MLGEGEKFASALISPNFEALKAWSAENGIKFVDKAQLAEERKVRELYSEIVKEFNKSLSKDEQVKRFRIVPDEWSPDTGELSPTLKLRRRILFAKYAGLINEIFKKAAA